MHRADNQFMCSVLLGATHKVAKEPGTWDNALVAGAASNFSISGARLYSEHRYLSRQDVSMFVYSLVLR